MARVKKANVQYLASAVMRLAKTVPVEASGGGDLIGRGTSGSGQRGQSRATARPGELRIQTLGL